MYFSDRIAQKIKNALKNKGVTAKQMLQDLGLGINTISELSKGKQISYISFAQIADYLSLSVDEILERENYKEKKPSLFESFSAEEIELIKAYRKHPEARVYARRILGLEAPPETARIAAKGNGEIQVGKKKPKITD